MLVQLVPAAVFHTWLYVNTGRSVLGAILLHWVGNLTGQLLLPSDDVRLVRLVLEYAAAAGIVAYWGAADLRRAPAERKTAPPERGRAS